jgi:hypothetical protein
MNSRILNLPVELQRFVLSCCSLLEKILLGSTCKALRSLQLEDHCEKKYIFYNSWRPFANGGRPFPIQRLLALIEYAKSTAQIIYLLPAMRKIQWSINADHSIIFSILENLKLKSSRKIANYMYHVFYRGISHSMRSILNKNYM